MIFFYSGSCGDSPGEPEFAMKDPAVMLSFHLIEVKQQTQHHRFRKILKARKLHSQRKGTHASKKKSPSNSVHGNRP